MENNSTVNEPFFSDEDLNEIINGTPQVNEVNSESTESNNTQSSQDNENAENVDNSTIIVRNNPNIRFAPHSGYTVTCPDGHTIVNADLPFIDSDDFGGCIVENNDDWIVYITPDFVVKQHLYTIGETRISEYSQIADWNILLQNTSATANSEVYLRTSGAPWFEAINQVDCAIVGAGGISSWLALILAKSHPKWINIYDFDKVEEKNIAGQLFATSNIGDYKVAAVANTVCKYADYYKTSCYTSAVTSSTILPDVVFCGVDSMAARKEIFYSWLNSINYQHDAKSIFIDGRLSPDCYQVICIQGEDSAAIDKYMQEYLFTDEEADETVCSFKQTAYLASMIASTMVNCFINWVSTQYCDLYKPVPFFTEYDANIMNFKTIM